MPRSCRLAQGQPVGEQKGQDSKPGLQVPSLGPLAPHCPHISPEGDSGMKQGACQSQTSQMPRLCLLSPQMGSSVFGFFTLSASIYEHRAWRGHRDE